MKRLLPMVPVALAAAIACGPSSPPAAPAPPAPPASIEAFRAAVQQILTETGVPGAGIALVRPSGGVWAGGVGDADREAHTPVTADTHFRVGSISKTFVAMALVQLSEEGELDLDAPVAEIAPLVEIDNPWDATDPVRIIHLLQHTAGFDDMHFNETYNVSDDPDLPLEEVLRVNPRSRRVRWRPGTRMSYSNPGYGVAGYVLEQATGGRLEDVIRTRIFLHAGMPTSSFTLTRDDIRTLAKGYDAPAGPAVPFSPIYLRPAGNMHTSAAELGNFVQLLLNWGETADLVVVDPEYLSNMEHPRTSLASRAGLLNGYGSGIASKLDGAYPLLGHDGGIEGFAATYAYSTARDAGYVVLLNASYGGAALERISDLAIRFLKADVAPAAKPAATVARSTLDRYVGYYLPANPRSQLFACLDWMNGGWQIDVDGSGLVATTLFGTRRRLVPVSDTLFRLEDEVDASRVFTTDDDGRMVMAGGGLYAERVTRWPIELARVSVLVALALALTPLLLVIPWAIHARRAEPRGFWWPKALLVAAAIALVTPVVVLDQLPGRALGLLSPATAAIFASTLAFPALSVLAGAFSLQAWIAGAGRWLRVYLVVVSVATLLLTAFMASWGLVGVRPWDY